MSDDWGWDDEDTSEKPSKFAVLPAGRHTATIVKASWAKKPPGRVPEKWRDKNPEGVRVELHLQVTAGGKTYLVFDDLPRHWRWKFESLSEALGVECPTPDSAWRPEDWVGLDVDVTTTIWAGEKGDRAQVERYYRSEPAPAPPEPAKRAARTPAAKVAQAKGEVAGNEDDIPFMWAIPLLMALASMGGVA